MLSIPWLTERPIAHRGLHDLNKTCWENTLSAFREAVRHDYAIECDVQIRLEADEAHRSSAHSGAITDRGQGLPLGD